MLRMFCMLLLCSVNAMAEEAIVAFHSAINIATNGDITVTEKITVRAENIKINRGIYRDFPTQYSGPWLTKKNVGFEILSVTRNGQYEFHHTEQLSNGVRIYMGSADIYLDRGEHLYELVYRTDQQLGYFENHDEFYWNVTGTGWDFPILSASVAITLPEGGREQVMDQSAWTGYQGEQRQDFVLHNSEETLGFKTTQRLAPYQGLTVGIQVPKGVFDPLPFDWVGFFKANGLWLIASALMLFYLGFYLSAWLRFGRDPEPGVIMARFKPPKDLSPAAVHYIDNQGANDQTLVAALVSMAVKGWITITQMKKQYRIKLINNRAKKPLSAGEKSVRNHLFSGRGRKVTISKQYNSSVKYAKGALNSKLKKEYQQKCFKDNGAYVLWGWLISVLCFFAGTLLIYQHSMNLGDLLVILIGFVVVITMALSFIAAAPIFMGFLLIFILASHYVDLFYWLLAHQKWLFFVLFLLGINFLFTLLLRAPTPFGRHLQDQIDGLKLYMQAAEEHRLNLMNPPDKNLQHYEELLPYAVALNLENHWAEQFTEVFANQDSEQPSTQQAFQPKWIQVEYSQGSDFSSSLGDFTRSIRRQVASAATTPSASRASSSSSYSSSSYSSSSSSSYSSSSSGGSSGGGW